MKSVPYNQFSPGYIKLDMQRFIFALRHIKFTITDCQFTPVSYKFTSLKYEFTATDYELAYDNC